MNEQQQWYVTIAGNAVGPVSTDLVLRGIKHKKIATEAYVCVVGANEWQALTDVPEFHGALKEHGLLPEVPNEPWQDAGEMSLAAMAAAQAESGQAIHALNRQSVNAEEPPPESLTDAVQDDDSELTSPFSSRRVFDMALHQSERPQQAYPPHDEQSEVTQVAALLAAQLEGDPVEEATALLPSRPAPQVEMLEAPDPFEAPSDGTGDAEPLGDSGYLEPRNGKHLDIPLLSRPPLQSIDVEVDIAVEEHEPAAPEVDWDHGFADYFLVDANVELPGERVLLRSLTTMSHETFLHDEAMWNLALCLAFGSNAVASVAADVFFDVVATHGQYERIEWVTRTLLSRGFMPSGIPHANGNRAIGRLRQACPDELRVQLEAQIGL